MPQYDIEQQKFAMGFTAQLLVMSEIGDQGKLQDLATKRLQALLSHESIKELIGEWEVVWGPVIYQHDSRILDIPFTRSQGADNCMYMVKCNNPDHSDQYVIAVAGTNLAFEESQFDTFVEAFSISKTRLWNQGQPWESPDDQTSEGKRISLGISKGLNILFNTQSNGKLLLEYLRELTSSNASLSITSSGHSLGCALSSTLALSLSDQQAYWNPNGNANLSVFSFGGFTTGNEEWANYYNEQLGGKTKFLWNELDIAHYWFQSDLLKKLPTLYSPYIEPNPLIYGVNYIYQKMRNDIDYQQICQDQKSFCVGYNPDAIEVIKSDIYPWFFPPLHISITSWLFQHLEYDAPPQELSNKVAEIVDPLIEACKGEIQSDTRKHGNFWENILNKLRRILGFYQKTTKTEVKLYIEKITAELLKYKSDLGRAEQLLGESLVGDNIKSLILYYAQWLYQHMYNYQKHMGVDGFFEIFVKDIKEKIVIRK
ncbi:MAG: lipase family protein [Symploca sp. SIO2E6]|nr:lipase family protein [Symploca sp. SIO2E6]